MFLPPELELLDYLSGGAGTYTYLERFVFDGDRNHALRSIEMMYQDGAISVTLDGQKVEAWRLRAWRRMPDDMATNASLERVCVELERNPYAKC